MSNCQKQLGKNQSLIAWAWYGRLYELLFRAPVPKGTLVTSFHRRVARACEAASAEGEARPADFRRQRLVALLALRFRVGLKSDPRAINVCGQGSKGWSQTESNPTNPGNQALRDLVKSRGGLGYMKRQTYFVQFHEFREACDIQPEFSSYLLPLGSLPNAFIKKRAPRIEGPAKINHVDHVLLYGFMSTSCWCLSLH